MHVIVCRKADALHSRGLAEPLGWARPGDCSWRSSRNAPPAKATFSFCVPPAVFSGIRMDKPGRFQLL